MRNKIPILYICIHERLCGSVGFNGLIKRKKLNEILGRLYHIDKKERVAIIKEAEDFNIIEKLDRHTFKVLPFNQSLADVSKVYHQLGLW